LAFVIFQLDLDFGLAVVEVDLGIVADIAFRLQHVENAGAQTRSRRGDLGLLAAVCVADAGQHIAERITHGHGLSPYQLDLTRPGMRPLLPSSRSATRDMLSFR